MIAFIRVCSVFLHNLAKPCNSFEGYRDVYTARNVLQIHTNNILWACVGFPKISVKIRILTIFVGCVKVGGGWFRHNTRYTLTFQDTMENLRQNPL